LVISVFFLMRAILHPRLTFLYFPSSTNPKSNSRKLFHHHDGVS